MVREQCGAIKCSIRTEDGKVRWRCSASVWKYGRVRYSAVQMQYCTVGTNNDRYCKSTPASCNLCEAKVSCRWTLVGMRENVPVRLTVSSLFDTVLYDLQY